MGNRHLIAVLLNKEYKVAQYGQWDGCPEVQGLTILNFLKNNDLNEFKKQVSKCRFFKDKNFLKKIYVELDIKPENGLITYNDHLLLKQAYPQLDIDMGGNILDYIMNTDDVLLKNSIDFALDSLFCEWGYVIDLDTNTLEVYKGFVKTPLKKHDRFYIKNYNKKRKKRELKDFQPIKEFIRFDINDLPSKEDFLNAFEEEKSHY